MSSDDKSDPELQELKGHVEQAVGEVFGDDELVARGKADQLAAHAKQAAAQAGESAKHLGQRVKDSAMRKLGELHERLHEEAGTDMDGENVEDAARERDAADEGGHPGV